MCAFISKEIINYVYDLLFTFTISCSKFIKYERDNIFNVCAFSLISDFLTHRKL